MKNGSEKPVKKKLTGPEQVEEFMGKLQHPLKEEIEEVRKIILSSDTRITEQIKWNAPSYLVDNDDRITFNLKGKGFFRLVFHCGAKVNPEAKNEPLFVDHTGLLEWQANDRAIVKFSEKDDIKAKEDGLRTVISEWIKATC
ncbi:DUF1801 domain-containing protein [Neobacillus piezotolerans]|uniref:DUF1801 domain-containing protein n=1 Tax=Neobacillus piezotolerans TaxID=2259171 RepID=A0A3D8GU89_9BACI|nr:DUF1801 domain-containing protein [Neobacillus piezotolerans]RDU37922.1 DUF1801 domain-containing protein [Neobacillus piezotolerans]